MSGCTLLLVSHSVQQILQFCQRGIWIDHGRVRMDNSARNVISAYEVEMEIKIQAEKLRSNAQTGVDNSRQSWLSELIARQDIGETTEDKRSREINIGGKPEFRWPGQTGVKITNKR